MKEKIINVKNVLKIIISLFIIFSMFKSCAKALTYEDLSDYVNRTASLYPNNVYYQRIKTAVNQNTFETNFPSIASDADFCYMYVTSGTGTTLYIYFYNATSYNITSTTMRYTGEYAQRNYNINNGSLTGTTQFQAQTNQPMCSNAYSTTTNDYNNLKGMNYNTDNFSSYTLPPTYVGMQALPQYTYLEFDNSHIDNTAYNDNIFTYYYQGNLYNQIQIKLGNIINNDSYYYECKFKDNNNIEIGTSFVSLNTTPINIYNTGAIEITENQEIYVNTLNIDYSKQYKLEITSYYGNGGTNLYEDIDWFIFLPQNAVISGDYIMSVGSGDFTNKDSTGLIIDNQNQNNSFWEDAYNNLFVMESGDVENIIEDMKKDLKKIHVFGDVSGEIAILNTLTGEPGDFIIAWNPTQYMNKTIIPSGEINFSQKVREIPALQTTQNWLRIVMGYSISIVLISEIFFTILKVLGVSVSIYDQHNEEIERLEEMHTPKVYDTEVITPKGIKRYRTRRTRIK